jgi:Na+-translocating ferredoxin:NAD+ oxidoreductase RnfE subunit
MFQVSNLALYEDIHVYVALSTISVFLLQRGLAYNEKVKVHITLIHHSLYGLGYVFALILFSIIRSVFTTGAVRLFGLQLRLFDVAYSFTLLDTAFGSLLLLGLSLGYIRSRKEGKNV